MKQKKWLNPFAALALGGAITYNFGYSFSAGFPFSFITIIDIGATILFLLPTSSIAIVAYLLCYEVNPKIIENINKIFNTNIKRKSKCHFLNSNVL